MKINLPLLSAAEQGAQDGARQWARETLKLARELSPTDTGESDRSGFTRVEDLTAQVGFSSLVSRLQHENLDYEHTGGGQPKFLEAAAMQVDAERIVAERVAQAFGG